MLLAMMSFGTMDRNNRTWISEIEQLLDATEGEPTITEYMKTFYGKDRYT